LMPFVNTYLKNWRSNLRKELWRGCDFWWHDHWLQALDVSVNKPFKDYLREEYEASLLFENLPPTSSAKIEGVIKKLLNGTWPLGRRLWKSHWSRVLEVLHYKCTLWHRRWYLMRQFWSWLSWFKKGPRRVCRPRVRDLMHKWGQWIDKFVWFKFSVMCLFVFVNAEKFYVWILTVTVVMYIFFLFSENVL
jgi:hypothetical protein